MNELESENVKYISRLKTTFMINTHLCRYSYEEKKIVNWNRIRDTLSTNKSNMLACLRVSCTSMCGMDA